MSLSAPRLPGLRFETARPPVPPGLPRMDVAAFVGFASAGPVGVPVAVDDEVRFRAIFGPDLPLAWDGERGETHYAHLALAVREFFRNGGRRCWVVRVGDEATLESAVFRLPAMLHGRGGKLEAAYLIAASPGSWADGTSLNATLLATSVGSTSVTTDSKGVRLKLPSPDLLRLEWPDGTIAFFPPHPGTPERDLTADERGQEKIRLFAHAYWFRRAALGELESPGAGSTFLGGPYETALAPVGWTVVREEGDERLEITLAADAVPELQPGCWIRARVAPAGSPPDPGEEAAGGGGGGGDGGDGGPPLVGRRAYLLVDEVARREEETRVVVRRAWRTLHHPKPWREIEGTGSLASLVAVELWMRRADGAVARMPDVGLVPGHPRFLGDLPPDQLLFAPTERLERSTDPSRPALATERLPLAAPDPELFAVAAGGAIRLVSRDGGGESLGGAPASGFTAGETADDDEGDGSGGFGAYLPIGALAVPRDDHHQAARTSGRDPLERNGVRIFSAELFLDPLLATKSTETLLDTAFHNAYVAEPALPPVRLHALLPVEEISLLAVPDAVHTGWRLRDPLVDSPPSPPGSPVITLFIPDPDEEGKIVVRWSAVDGALSYTLEDSPDPRFRHGVRATVSVVEPGEHGTSVTVSAPPDCPARLYFRVCAHSIAGRGAWSPTVLLALPEHEFGVCGATPLEPPVITSVAITGERLTVRWESAAEPAEVTRSRAAYDRVFLLQSSPEPGFACPEPVYEGTRRVAELWKPLSGTLYLRVAARLQEKPGADDAVAPRIVEESPWSPVREQGTQPPPRWETIPVPEADEGVLPAIHQAMLRFCAARSDCLAVLALPRHHRVDDALAYVSALTTALGGGSTGAGDAAGRTLSFGALYHPWTVVRTTVASASLRAIPPDGATCGVMAARANELGAWAAPANRPIAGVAILEPKLPESVRAAWLGKKVNALAPFARGFMTWSEETLSDDPLLRGVGVRRLLILLRRLALREGHTYAFEPNDPAFRRLVQRQFDNLLGRMFSLGAFAGRSHAEGYRVVTDESVNPPQNVEQGRLVVELRVAPSRPLAFLTVRLVQTGAGLAVQEG